MIVVDTNVLVDVLSADPRWMPWSLSQLAKARSSDALGINLIVYAELCTHEPTATLIDEFLADSKIALLPLTTNVARRAAAAFLAYRRRKGVKTGVLPDFFIGAHALVDGHTLLTRDAARYRTYFKGLALICP